MLNLAHLAGFLVHTRQVNLGNKLNRRRDIWICIATMDVEAIDSVLVGALVSKCSAKDVAAGRVCSREVVPR